MFVNENPDESKAVLGTPSALHLSNCFLIVSLELRYCFFLMVKQLALVLRSVEKEQCDCKVFVDMSFFLANFSGNYVLKS